VSYKPGTTNGLVIGALVLNAPFVLLGGAVLVVAFPKAVLITAVALVVAILLPKIGK
jgi:hypothetical protein